MLMGGNVGTCMKCINLVDVAVSAAVGAVSPTWLGNVAKDVMILRRAGSLRALGAAAVNLQKSTAIRNAQGAALGTAAGAAAKIELPDFRIGCDDECAKYRLGAKAMGISTSLY
jgi:hypothetical protein